MKNFFFVWCLLLFWGSALANNNKAAEKLLALCEPYSTSLKLELKAHFYLIHKNERTKVESFVLKRDHESLFIEQSGFALLVIGNQLLEADKMREELVVSKVQPNYIEKVFESFNPLSFLTYASSIKEEKSKKGGRKFKIGFELSSPYSEEEIYFNSNNQIERILIKKRELDPLTGELNIQTMEVVYTTAAYNTEVDASSFSTGYFFQDKSLKTTSEKFKNYTIINHPKH